MIRTLMALGHPTPEARKPKAGARRGAAARGNSRSSASACLRSRVATWAGGSRRKASPRSIQAPKSASVAKPLGADQQPSEQRPAGGVELVRTGQRDGLVVTLLSPRDHQLVTDHPHRHVAPDHKADAAEHLPLDESRVIAQPFADPIGQRMVIGHGQNSSRERRKPPGRRRLSRVVSELVNHSTRGLAEWPVVRVGPWCRWPRIARRVVCSRWERPRSAALVISFAASPSVLTSNLVLPTPAAAATVPAGFTDTVVASGMTNPTAMAFAPDGRLFVAQQGGALRVIKNGSLLATPFLTVTVNASGERGLLGIAFDPDFTLNRHVYVYYTATRPRCDHNRVSRFTANGDVAVPGSEVVILDLPTLSATNHNGGAIHFGPDGKLYVAVGENAARPTPKPWPTPSGSCSGSTATARSRPTTRSTAPPAASTGRSGPAAFGTHSPSPSSRAPVGCSSTTSGRARGRRSTTESRARTTVGRPPKVQRAPRTARALFAYGHGNGPVGGCAIAGGAFYNPVAIQFPASYVGSYFFADLCAGSIYRIEPTNGYAISTFAQGSTRRSTCRSDLTATSTYLAREGEASWAGSPTRPPPPPMETTFSPTPCGYWTAGSGLGYGTLHGSVRPATWQVAGVGGLPARGRDRQRHRDGPDWGWLSTELGLPHRQRLAVDGELPGRRPANNVTIAQPGAACRPSMRGTRAASQLVFDVTGYFLAERRGTYVPLTPARGLDTRVGRA